MKALAFFVIFSCTPALCGDIVQPTDHSKTKHPQPEANSDADDSCTKCSGTIASGDSCLLTPIWISDTSLYETSFDNLQSQCCKVLLEETRILDQGSTEHAVTTRPLEDLPAVPEKMHLPLVVLSLVSMVYWGRKRLPR